MKVILAYPIPMDSATSQHPLSFILQVPPVFAAARNALYTRYTPNDWMASNQSNYMASDRVRSGRWDRGKLRPREITSSAKLGKLQ